MAKVKGSPQNGYLKSSSSGSDNTSTQDIITMIVYNAIICGTMCGLFLLFRLKFHRIYEPKAYFDIVPRNQRTSKLSRNPIFWFKTVITRTPQFMIREAGIDGYLFIRYLTMMMYLFGGAILSWIILFPVTLTNSKNESGMDQLSMSNVGTRGRYYAYVLVAYFFYGMAVFLIYRERIFYSNLRAAAVASPLYARRLASRTVLFQTVPDKYLSEHEIRKLYDGVKRIWVTRCPRELEKKVSKRRKLCRKLESSLSKMLKRAVHAKLRADKKGEKIEPDNDLGSYVPDKKRPTLRPKRFSKKVDTLEYCKEQIPILNDEIEVLQSKYSEVEPLTCVFVEFVDQYAAQIAYQTTAHDKPLHFQPKEINVTPEAIFWPNLRMYWWERIARSLAASAVIVVLLVFWAIPSSFVGLLSNLTYLTNKITFLKFVYKLPGCLLGLITALLPSVLMSLLMSVLPWFVRSMAKFAGRPTSETVELYTQHVFFAFQVIQVFLVTTISSSVTSVLTQIMEKPETAMTLLSSNLPKCSNFFISYVLFQGFTISSGSLLQVINLILYYINGKLFDGTPRKKWIRFNGLGHYTWGTVFPTYTNLVVITMAYAIISPMILLFSTASFAMLVLTYMNNANYVIGFSEDSLGRYYSRALSETMTGIYLGEVCLLGLFLVNKTWGPVIMQLILLLVTVFVHVQSNEAFGPLLHVVPKTVMRPRDGATETLSWKQGDLGTDLQTTLTDYKEKGEKGEKWNLNLNSDTDSASPFYDAKESIANEVQVEINPDVPLLIDGYDDEVPKDRNAIVRFFMPSTYLSFRYVKNYLPDSFYELPDEPESYIETAYDYKVVSEKCPKVWIPRDPMGLSQIEIERFKGIVEISDANASFDAKGRIIWTGCPPDEQKDDNHDSYWTTFQGTLAENAL